MACNFILKYRIPARSSEFYERFMLDICRMQTNLDTKNIIDESIANIRKQVGNEKVLLGLSGGVDSSVVAALLHKAIGDQLICVFVDTGLLRLNEAEQVKVMFENIWDSC